MPQAEILHYRECANRILAQNLQLARTEGQYTQEELAERMQTDRAYISRVECGHNTPNFASILLYARATGIPAWRIIRRVERLIAAELEQQKVASDSNQQGTSAGCSSVP